MMPSEKSQAPSPLQSIAAGAAAGGVESLVTYPTEYIKTRKQLLGASSVSSLRLLATVIRQHGVGVLYAGAGAFCVSNASKSGVRFFTFDGVRSRLPKDSNTGKPTKTSNMIAGVAAGIAESVTVVTPGESIKTKIVEDRGGARKFTSTKHVIWSTLQTQGVRGLYRGVVPVTLKQGSNALVRFTSYHAIFDAIEPSLAQAGYGTFIAPVAGALAGIITVYATMPFDTIKTRMQGLNAGSGKKGTLQISPLDIPRIRRPRLVERNYTQVIKTLCVWSAKLFYLSTCAGLYEEALDDSISVKGSIAQLRDYLYYAREEDR